MEFFDLSFDLDLADEIAKQTKIKTVGGGCTKINKPKPHPGNTKVCWNETCCYRK